MDDVQIDAEDTVSATEEPDNQSQEGESQEGGESQETEDRVTFSEAQQAKFNEVISQKVANTHEERHQKEEALARVAELEAQIPKPQAPDVPPMPDPELAIDDPAKFNAAIEARETALTERAAFNANQDFLRKQGEFQAFEAQQKQEVKDRQAIENYTQAATSFGIDTEKMVKDANLVAQVLSLPVKDFISEDPQGPLISSHLAGSPVELDLLSSMSPAKAAIHIENKIKPKLSGARKSTQAPAPADIVDGQGSPAKKRGPKGATFE